MLMDEDDDNNNDTVLQQCSVWFQGLKSECCCITQCACVISATHHRASAALDWAQQMPPHWAAAYGHNPGLSISLSLSLSLSVSLSASCSPVRLTCLYVCRCVTPGAAGWGGVRSGQRLWEMTRLMLACWPCATKSCHMFPSCRRLPSLKGS